MSISAPKSPLTVSQLNRQVKQLLETQYPAVPVQGEISTLSRPASGHQYFTLKDGSAQIRCAFFKGSAIRNRYQLKQGDEVVVYGRVSLYEGRGDYQLIASQVQPVGEGALQAAFFALKEKLAAEGLFDPDLKRPLPSQPKRIGVVTSATGAAFHDILTVLNRRAPSIEVVLYPAIVQGQEGEASIIAAIKAANRRQEVDCLIVGRGGGSLEDLWCFNLESVARAIADSNLPVLSAVGHETDVSIADFVADARAATPSQAAEMLSPDQYEQMQAIDRQQQRLQRAMRALLAHHRHHLNQLSPRIKHPSRLLKDFHDRVLSLDIQMKRTVRRFLSEQHQALSELSRTLKAQSPVAQLRYQTQQVSALKQRLVRAESQTRQDKARIFKQWALALDTLSPLKTLDRGYSITRTEHGQVVQSSKEVQVGDKIETLLLEGRVQSTVTAVSDQRLPETPKN